MRSVEGGGDETGRDENTLARGWVEGWTAELGRRADELAVAVAEDERYNRCTVVYLSPSRVVGSQALV